MLAKEFLVYFVLSVVLSLGMGAFIPIEVCKGNLNKCSVDCKSWGSLDLRKVLKKKTFNNIDFAAENGVIFVDTHCGVLPDHFAELMEGDEDGILEWQIGSLNGEFALNVVFPSSLEDHVFGDVNAMETTFNLMCSELSLVGSTIVDAQGEGLTGKYVDSTILVQLLLCFFSCSYLEYCIGCCVWCVCKCYKGRSDILQIEGGITFLLMFLLCLLVW